MRLLAIDPGTNESAYVLIDVDTEEVLRFAKIPNEDMREILLVQRHNDDVTLAIEQLKSYGNALGDSVLLTAVWVGRFLEVWSLDHRAHLVPRKTIATELCGRSTANDSNVRRAVMNHYETILREDSATCSKLLGCKEPSLGIKSNPGPLYGLKKDVWQALGLAIAHLAIQRRELNFLS